jgi:hypothetical protein
MPSAFFSCGKHLQNFFLEPLNILVARFSPGLSCAYLAISFKRRAVVGTTDLRRSQSAELQLLLLVQHIAAESNASQRIVELILVRL